MAARWKKKPPKTALHAFATGPRTSFLHTGDGKIILQTAWIADDGGWYWYGLRQNTRESPCATEDEAKAEAMAFYTEHFFNPEPEHPTWL